MRPVVDPLERRMRGVGAGLYAGALPGALTSLVLMTLRHPHRPAGRPR